jgi:hypothetical protein
MNKKNLGPDPSSSIFSRNRYPISRDFELENLNIKCGKVTCAANHNKKCIMPSLIELNNTGKCKGYSPRKGKE